MSTQLQPVYATESPVRAVPTGPVVVPPAGRDRQESKGALASRERRRHEDRETLERIIDGDSDAIAALYDRYASMLLALARQIVQDQSEAEEVLQDTFVQVWKQAGRYQSSRASVSTWLVLLTRSRAIDRLRSRGTRQRVVAAAQAEESLLHVVPEGPRDVLQKERQQRLRREMDQLPRNQRLVLELAYYRGMTQSEISAQEGIPLGTVKTRSLAGMRQLRRVLHDELRELL